MPLQDIYNYFRSYDRQTYEVYAQQGAEPSQADITSFESRIGFRLPDEFREYAVHPLGGLYMAVKEELWPRASKFQVGPFWSFLYGLRVYCLSRKAPDWLQMDKEWQRMAGQGSSQLVPFLSVMTDPDPYCFTSTQKIVIWRHEAPEEPELISETFSEVLMKEIQALEIRKMRKMRGDDRIK